jgi:hypothetical protein
VPTWGVESMIPAHLSQPRPCLPRAAAAADATPSPTAAARSKCSPQVATAGTEAIMLAHGFTIADMVALVRAGLASATAERVVAGSRKFEVACVRITEAGRALDQKPPFDKLHSPHGLP